jgi:transposase InsO family protein
MGMSMARVVITAVVVEKRTRSEVAREYGVSRRWVQKLVARYEADGETAFAPRSRRPHHHPARTPVEVEDQIVACRKHLIETGWDAGAQTIATVLAERGVDVPSVATIWRILSRRGFLTPQPHKRPRSSWRRFEAELPNECWQADITHWLLANGREVEILNIEDDHSRLLVGSTVRGTFKAADVVTDCHAAITRHGRPERVLTDNGAVFTGSYRGLGWVALERELVALGIVLRHSRPYHPQTCGKVERLHQTLKKWLAKQPRSRSLQQLQQQLDEFRAHYNTRRPHRALNRRTPDRAWHDRPRAIPTQPGILIDRHFRVRRDRIDTNGTLTLRHNSRLHHIGIGRHHAGTHVLVLALDTHIRVITEDGQLLRDLTLDPDHDYQPQSKTPPANR